MNRLMHILFLSCLKATELIEKKLHFRLSLTEKLQLKTHKMMCDACQRYEKQSELLDRGVWSVVKEINQEDSLEDLKDKIIESLDSQKK